MGQGISGPIALYQRLYNLRCPACDAVQPVFALSSTFKGGLSRFALNGFAPCVQCHRKLKVVPRHAFAATAAFQVLFAVVMVVIFFGFALPVVILALRAFGPWGILVLAAVMLVWPFLAARLIGLWGPFYREVKLL